MAAELRFIVIPELAPIEILSATMSSKIMLVEAKLPARVRTVL
jgi:hypothetical protein